jgi:pimeloyl-ACP methyl ester carboxylesterase
MQHEHTLDLGSGRSLFVHQRGKGRDVVLIHGAITTSHDMLESETAERLAAKYRLTILDRPGHGGSRRPRFAGTPRDQADQIVEGFDRLGIERPVIVAHSYGALVALALAERHPERVASLVLIAPLAFPEPRLLEHLLLAPRAAPITGPLFSQWAEAMMLDRAMLPLIQKLMFWPEDVPARWKKTFPTDTLLSAEALVFQGEDAATMLPLSPAGTINMTAIGTPAHVLTGTSDKVVEDERQAKALARLLPDARLTEIVGGGHMLHHSHADEVVAAVEGAFAKR